MREVPLRLERRDEQATATNPPRFDAFVVIGLVASALMFGLSFFARPGSTYRFSFVFLLPLLWGVYALRHRLHLHPAHFALLASALLLHNLGVFGLYRREFLGLQFDTYVHFYFGFCCALAVRRGLEMAFGVRGWRVWLAVTLAILGFGAIHELIEWASTMALGPERGMLKMLGDDPYDTQKDLLNNLLGTLLSLTVSTFLRFASWTEDSKSPPSPPH